MNASAELLIEGLSKPQLARLIVGLHLRRGHLALKARIRFLELAFDRLRKTGKEKGN